MPDNTITIIGNVTRDPELRYLNGGSPVASFSIAVNRRWQNKSTQEWEEQVSFFDVCAYGSLAENVAESITKGNRVIVSGRLEQRSWEKDGEKKSKVEVVADEVAPSLRWATAQVTRNERRDGDGGGRPAPRPAAAGNQPSSGGYGYDEEPF